MRANVTRLTQAVSCTICSLYVSIDYMGVAHNRSVGTKSARRRTKYLAQQNRTLIAKLVQIRKESGLSQADVAELLGNTQQAISEFERMLTPTSLSRISNYAHAVGALVTHHVAKDCGQLEVHGDRWIQFNELPLSEEESVTTDRIGSVTSLRIVRNDDEVSIESADESFTGPDVSVITPNNRTYFALSA